MKVPITDDYDSVLIRVHSRDSRGRPEMISVIWEDQTVHLVSGDKFYTAFINKSASLP